MKPGKIYYLILIPFLWFGCSISNPTIDQSEETDSHLHSITRTRSFGDRHYHAVMKYNDREGILAIEFSDTAEEPVKIIREKFVKARLAIPGKDVKEFSFINPVVKKYPSGSRQAKKQLRQKPKSELIYVKENFLKNLSNFSLKVWIPVKGTTYVIKYNYPKSDYMPDAYFILGDVD